MRYRSAYLRDGFSSDHDGQVTTEDYVIPYRRDRHLPNYCNTNSRNSQRSPMNRQSPGLLTKLEWSLPWLTRYPFWRVRQFLARLTANREPPHLLFMVANHFEPSWRAEGGFLTVPQQMLQLEKWCRMARMIGENVRDGDGKPFRHTNFYPAEQYHRPLLERLAQLQADGFGEVEVHLHHGVEKPDDAANLQRQLETFRDILATEHKCLSRRIDSEDPMYAFVHGNLALANSASGRFCGVDEELQILAKTGCYADFTMPSAPDETQVPKINAIYECGHPLWERRAHRSGPNLQVGRRPKLPILITGPLVFNWNRRIKHVPIPRLDDGVLAKNYPPGLDRLERWRKAQISVRGRPDWVFIKLYCHGFFTFDQDASIGSSIRQFWELVLELSERTSTFKVHFVTAREAFNIALAAVDGLDGNPGQYCDYELRLIMEDEAARPR